MYWSKFDGKIEESVVAQHAVNLSRAYRDMELRKGPIIRFCALWTTSEGEDIAGLTDDQVKEKANDWVDIDMDFFFQIVTSRVPHYLKNWQSISRMISRLERAGKIDQDSLKL